MSLENTIAGHVISFLGDDYKMDDGRLLEITDTDNGVVEMAFDMINPKRRVYVRFRLADLKAALAQRE